MDDQYDLGIKYSCDACFGDISQVVRIKCAECVELDLCVDCFSTGTTVKDHRPEHDFFVIEPLTFPIYQRNWTAQEELLLLEGLEKKGMGNWNDVARHVGSKPAKECEAHYHTLYLESPEFPLPNPTVTVSKEEKHLGAAQSVTPSGSLNDSQLFNGPGPGTVLTSNPANHEIAGFMPKRADFECEHDNDFENTIKDLQFNEREDTPLESQLKLALLHSYCGVLERREERKRFAIDRNLVQFKQVQSREKGRKKEEKAILLSTRQFARFVAPDAYETLLQGFVLEHRLAGRIGDLQGTRRKSQQPSMISVPPKHLSALLSRCASDNSGSVARHDSTDSIRSSSGYSMSLENSDNLLIEKSDSAIDPLAVGSVAKRRQGIPIDLTDVEGVELLSNGEIELCSLLRLLPRVYLNIKETLLKEQAKLGYLKRAVARGLVKIDVNKTSRIYDFFVAAGWIKPTK